MNVESLMDLNYFIIYEGPIYLDSEQQCLGPRNKTATLIVLKASIW